MSLRKASGFDEMKTRKQNSTGQKQRKFWLLHFALFAAILTLSPMAAQAAAGKGGHKLAADLANFPVNADGTVDVIIQFNQTPKAQHFAALAAQGGRKKFTFDHINGA